MPRSSVLMTYCRKLYPTSRRVWLKSGKLGHFVWPTACKFVSLHENKRYVNIKTGHHEIAMNIE